jgi:tRNA threonylcarbamoyladenosine biosynthesis protein TsaB
MARGYTLAIEISNPSSGPRGPRADGTLAGPGVALGRTDDEGDAVLLGAELLREGTRHDDDLMPAIDRLMDRHSARPAELSRIAVSIGPGGYTSLRIAVATAKMLSEATGAETIAVPSTAVAAYQIPGAHAPAIVCLASKHDAAYGELLPPPLRDSDWWRLHGRPGAERLVGLAAAAELDAQLRAGLSWLHSLPLGMITAGAVEALRPAALIADSFLPAPMREAAERVGAEVVEPVFAPASVLYLSEGRSPIDPVALSPLYGREPEAVTQWRVRKHT